MSQPENNSLVQNGEVIDVVNNEVNGQTNTEQVSQDIPPSRDVLPTPSTSSQQRQFNGYETIVGFSPGENAF